MQLKYIAFDSMGVKSSCFMAESAGKRILVDPGISEQVDSFPFPAPERNRMRDRYERDIRRACKPADVIVITHYHYDHHIPDKRLYSGKTLLIKDPVKSINESQRERAKTLLDMLGPDVDVRIADGKSFRFGKLLLKFSKPVWHGPAKTNLGHVVMLAMTDGKRKVLYTSDVSGMYEPGQADMIIRERPDILILDGPPTYLLGYIMSYYNLAKTNLNICRVIEKARPGLIILDHHLLRDYRYPDLLHECYRLAERLGVKMTTAAEYLGKRPAVMRGYRKNGPTKWKNWKTFDRAAMVDVLRNAVENKLIARKWLDMAKRL